MKETTNQWSTSNRKNRQEEIKLSRLRIGHSKMTYSYLLNKTDPPVCEKCTNKAALTIEHIIAVCPALQHLRIKHEANNKGQPNSSERPPTEQAYCGTWL